MYGTNAKKHISVILCAFIVLTSLSTVCALQCPVSGGMCYIMPVYTNVYRFVAYNKQTLENDDSDIQWIKESADVLRHTMSERIVPLTDAVTDVAIYATVKLCDMQSFGFRKGRIYHMLN